MSTEISEVGLNSVGGAKQEKKRLIVCCDGTWNDSISSDSPLTNVSRISRLITDIDENSPSRVPQVVYYHTGVGSGTSPAGNVVDGMSGRGISANIRNAYSFICYNFSNEQDEIVLIGFSRGAFTVQAVATLIADVGLLTKPGLGHLCEVYKIWKIKPHDNDNRTSHPRRNLREKCNGLSQTNELRTGIKVKVCAVWDAVGSLGFPVPDPFPQKASRRLAHINSKLCNNIEVAIQALALNERRKHFQVTVWKADDSVNNRILKQCWFLGNHSDVGGGNKDTGLANIALVWMITQLRPYVGFDLEALRAFTSTRVQKASEESTEFDMPRHMSPTSIKANIGTIIPASVVAGISRRSRYETPIANISRSKGNPFQSPRPLFSLDKYRIYRVVVRENQNFHERSVCPRRIKAEKAMPVPHGRSCWLSPKPERQS
nr:hypothetical protein FAC7G5_16 [Penicillium fuscum]